MYNIYFLLLILFFEICVAKLTFLNLILYKLMKFTEQFSSNIYVIPNNLHFPSISAASVV